MAAFPDITGGAQDQTGREPKMTGNIFGATHPRAPKSSACRPADPIFHPAVQSVLDAGCLLVGVVLVPEIYEGLPLHTLGEGHRLVRVVSR